MSLGALDFGLHRRRVGRDGRELRPAARARRHALSRPAPRADPARPHSKSAGRSSSASASSSRSTCPSSRSRGSRAACSRRWPSPCASPCSGRSLLALTYVPMLSSFLLTRVRETPSRWFEAVRMPLPGHCWPGRCNTGLVVVGRRARCCWCSRSASVPFLGTEFMPKLDEGSLLIETRRLPSTSLPQGMADCQGGRANADAVPRGARAS